LLVNQLAPALVRNAVPDEDVGPLQTLLANIGRILGSPQAAGADVQTLTTQVEELKRMVQDQQARIGELQQRLRNR
jgi:peptidoglycan hydrolase CwlO-like protein